MSLLAQADAAFQLSLVKPPIVALVLAGWAWVVSHLDKDAGFFYLKQGLFSLAHLVAAIVGFGLMLAVPAFWVGLPLGLLVLLSSIAGYVVYRNKQVPPGKEWTLDLESFKQNLEQRQQRSAQKSAAVRLQDSNGTELEVPQSNDPRYAAHRAVENLLDYAIARSAGQVDLAVEPEQTKLSVKIDGVSYKQDPLEPKLALQVIDYLKAAAGQDVEDRRRKQTGRITAIDDEGTPTDLEVVTAGSTRGLKLQAILDPDRVTEMPLSMLGLLPAQLEYVESLLSENKGVVMVAADRHQGGPTTMYALVHHVDPYINSVVSVEESDAIELEGVDRHIIDRSTPAGEFNQKLGVIIRSDPNVVMLDRVADADTLKAVGEVGADMRFLLPLPAENATKALSTYVKAVGDRKQAARSLATVIAQRLVRTLCPTCRVPYKPDPSAIKKLNLPADKVGTLYKASGKVLVKDREQECPDCHGIGYRGRTGIFEVMPLDDTARQLITGGDHDQLRNHLRKQGMVYLQEAALAKVVEGHTDIKEVQRVLSGKGSD